MCNILKDVRISKEDCYKFERRHNKSIDEESFNMQNGIKSDLIFDKLIVLANNIINFCKIHLLSSEEIRINCVENNIIDMIIVSPNMEYKIKNFENVSFGGYIKWDWLEYVEIVSKKLQLDFQILLKPEPRYEYLYIKPTSIPYLKCDPNIDMKYTDYDLLINEAYKTMFDAHVQLHPEWKEDIKNMNYPDYIKELGKFVTFIDCNKTRKSYKVQVNLKELFANDKLDLKLLDVIDRNKRWQEPDETTMPITLDSNCKHVI